MEAVLLPENSISPYRNSRKARSNFNSVSSIPSENLIRIDGGFFGYPPSLSSFFSSSFSPQQQPPLLPLPFPSRNRSFFPSLPPPLPSKKAAKTKDRDDITPKKSKPLKKECFRSSSINAQAKRLGPDPVDPPKEVPKVLKTITAPNTVEISRFDDLEMFSGSIFPLAPPPSSLPLPKFSLRPKTSCNAEPVEVDAGATNNLRQILRLR